MCVMNICQKCDLVCPTCGWSELSYYRDQRPPHHQCRKCKRKIYEQWHADPMAPAYEPCDICHEICRGCHTSLVWYENRHQHWCPKCETFSRAYPHFQNNIWKDTEPTIDKTLPNKDRVDIESDESILVIIKAKTGRINEHLKHILNK